MTGVIYLEVKDHRPLYFTYSGPTDPTRVQEEINGLVEKARDNEMVVRRTVFYPLADPVKPICAQCGSQHILNVTPHIEDAPVPVPEENPEEKSQPVDLPSFLFDTPEEEKETIKPLF